MKERQKNWDSAQTFKDLHYPFSLKAVFLHMGRSFTFQAKLFLYINSLLQSNSSRVPLLQSFSLKHSNLHASVTTSDHAPFRCGFHTNLFVLCEV